MLDKIIENLIYLNIDMIKFDIMKKIYTYFYILYLYIIILIYFY